MHYVIIGGGIAGTTAAEELRKLDPVSEITIVSDEFHPLYSRVLLPHYIKGKIPRERCFLKKDGWYAEQKIELVVGVSVTALHPSNKLVELSDGRELTYDKLLVATGGELKVLPSDVRGVSYLRTLDDADHLDQLLKQREPGARGGVFGGGFIACEYLNLFANAGMKTTIAFRSAYFWSSILEPSVGLFINQHLIKQGVEVVPDASFIETQGEKELTGFVTSKGTFPCSILGVGIGIEVEDGWLKRAGLKSDQGILCDHFLQTNIEDIFAAGDAARFYDDRVEAHVMVGNWMNAQMQGRVVAKNMFSQPTVFSLVSSYATNALGLEIIFIGDVSREDADQIQVIGSQEEGGIGQLFEKNGKLIGAVLLNRNTDRPAITKLIQDQKPMSDFVSSI